MVASQKNQQSLESLAEWLASTSEEDAASLVLTVSEVATLVRCSANALQRARMTRDELIATGQTPDPSSLASLAFIQSAGSQDIAYPMLAVKQFLK
jgi:hypothetical protein